MSEFNKKVDFVVLVSVKLANPNGDPLNGNRPRTDYNGYGEISDVCIKRKIRNRMQNLGEKIFVQSDSLSDDNNKCLKDRAKELSKEEDAAVFEKKACENWIDVRSFGQVFAFKGFKCSSVGIRGPVSIHLASSIDPVEITSMQITKSVSGESANEKGSDTMGMKHFVRFGLYKVKGSINVQLAEKTGFSEEDADIIKECLRTLFMNDASAARPEGSMEVVKLYWWKHNCKNGQYSTAKVHNSLKVHLKEGIEIPNEIDDYEIEVEKLDGLEPEIIEGV